ncbi:hypothetical protein PR202_gb25435 [Eleusine coracana subsp. coracana]|uniref:Uncharacterized protein n=1 Tax=Eleusine coracana subsp. coracana TaxID=191504 RepID=A0AAV5FP90_ELECO|nr:hypothetical protein PR202_gb25435 [Eleusine coracana subsp. coracana]
MRWRRLVVDHAFLRRRWPEGCSSLGESSLLGFFVQRHWFHSRSGTKVSRLFPSSSPLFVPTPDSVLGPERRFLTSFICDDAKALVARGGLLLVRLAPRSSDNNNFLRLCLCNLLIGKLELLPLLDASLLNRNGIVGYGLLTTADHEAGPQILADGSWNRAMDLLRERSTLVHP